MTKTTSQTIPIDHARSLRVDVRNAKVYYKKSRGNRIIIEAEIQLSVPNETLLNYIINNGRYELQYSIDPETNQLLLTSLREKDIVIVRGDVCKERVIYTIYIPAALRSQTQW